MSFKEVNIEQVPFNPFHKIGREWMLITAGTEEKCNTMTASWGGAGVLWGKNVATAYIRPQRYTKEFVDANDTFSLTFFNEQYRKALSLCGSASGRDGDKIGAAGLTPCFIDGTPAFEEADMILICKKMYHSAIVPECFDLPENEVTWYPENDYHVMYIAEITKALIKEA